MMKQIFSKIIFSAICFVSIFTPFISFAQGTVNTSAGGGSGAPTGEYTPITPGGMGSVFSGASGAEGLPGMLTWIFRTSISITVILAVLMLIIGGIQYMNSESPYMKTNGKDKMLAAIGGLLIALTSILLLSTVWGKDGSLRLSIFPTIEVTHTTSF